jgi:hypothetical protein
MLHIRRSTPLGALTLLAAAALTAGCGSTGSVTSSTTATPTAAGTSQAPASAPASTDAASGGPDAAGTVLGGNALQTRLDAVSVAKGFSIDSSSKDSSGATPTTPSDYEALQSCSDLTNAGADTLTSDHEAAYATYELDDSDDLEVDVVAADYYPGDADKQMSEVAALVAKCPSYKAQDIDGNDVTLKVTSSARQGLGDQALDVHVRASTSGYVSDEFLLVRKGDTIVAMDQDDAAGDSMADLATMAAPYVTALG